MAQDSSLPQFLKLLSRFLVFAAFASGFGFLGLFYHYDATRPTVRQPGEGRNYPSNNHGHVVYLSGQDEYRLHLLEIAAFYLCMTGIVLDYVQRQQLTLKQIRGSALNFLYAIFSPASWLGPLSKLRQYIGRTCTGNETRNDIAYSTNRRDAISLYTAKGISECQRMVKSVGYSAFGVVLASFDGYKFRLYVRRDYRNSFAPLFSGRLVPQTTGTRVEGRFGMHPFVKIFLAVWFAGVVTIGGFIFVSSIGQALSGDVSDNSKRHIGMVVPPILLGFGVLLVRFGKKLGRDEETRILSWLKRSFADTTQKPISE